MVRGGATYSDAKKVAAVQLRDVRVANVTGDESAIHAKRPYMLAVIRRIGIISMSYEGDSLKDPRCMGVQK